MNKTTKLKTAAKSALISAIVVPAMGVVAHLMPGKGVFTLDDASLAHCMECAYTLNPNPEHKTYLSHEVRENGTYNHIYDIQQDREVYVDEDGMMYNKTWIESDFGKYDTLYSEEEYMAHPFLIYPLHIAVAGLAYARMRRKQEEQAKRGATRSR